MAAGGRLPAAMRRLLSILTLNLAARLTFHPIRRPTGKHKHCLRSVPGPAFPVGSAETRLQVGSSPVGETFLAPAM